jgi:rare lipoprotein A
MIFSTSLCSFTADNGEGSNDVKTTVASYYHDKFNGRKTACGEIFDNSKMTAANKTLPFGTRVKVTNLKTGKSVIVRINDRGPYHRARSLDLSKAAFNKIAHHSQGIVKVSYEILDDEEEI